MNRRDYSGDDLERLLADFESRNPYGKGYFDRFMKNCHPNALLVGLSFFTPVAQIDGILEIDVPLTHCITPEQIYVF